MMRVIYRVELPDEADLNFCMCPFCGAVIQYEDKDVLDSYEDRHIECLDCDRHIYGL